MTTEPKCKIYNVKYDNTHEGKNKGRGGNKDGALQVRKTPTSSSYHLVLGKTADGWRKRRRLRQSEMSGEADESRRKSLPRM